MSYIGRQLNNLSDRVKLDSITASATATYNLLLNGVAYVPSSAESLTVSLNGVVQAPVDSYTVSSSTITFASALTSSDSIDFILAERSITLQTPSAGSVGLTQLSATGTKDATTFLRGDNTFSTVTSTTINNNADNRIITGSSTANTLEGESNLTYDGSTLTVKPASNVHQLKLEQNNATDYWSLHADSSGGPLTFNRYTGGAETEKVRFQSNGDVFFGCTGTPSASVKGIAIEQDNELLISTNSTSADTIVRFFNNNGQVGKIETSGSSTSYDTSSDYRLKENINYDFDATTRVKQLKPARFNFIADADTTLDGFIAHEVTPIVPEAISGEKDAVDSEGNIDPQGIDQSKLVPLLTKALQEAITKIETLEAKVEALENA